MNAERVLRELEGMRALARSLVHGDADAEDLQQDVAVGVLEHPPPDDRPLRPWLARVLRNRRRMDVRAAARRAQREREATAFDEPHAEAPDSGLDRARAFERLAAAVVALDEPFRATVIARYLDGRSAADIARADGIPAGTVRWRLATGLARLRAALDDTQPRWRRALIPLVGAPLVKTKTTFVTGVVLLLLLAAVAIVWFAQRDDDTAARPAAATAPVGSARAPAVTPPVVRAETPLPTAPGQARPTVEVVEGPGVVDGRVINWSTGEGVAGADVTFTSGGVATTVRSDADGRFELAPPAPGRYTLSAISAAGFLPYAPELLHSNVRVEVVKDRAVRGVTVFLFPAIDYAGRVVDARGAPVANAKVRLLGTPEGEQAIDKLATEWTTDRDGAFTFHAADDAVFEAVRGSARGWARLDEDIMITRELVIRIADAAPRTGVIAGRVVDEQGAPLPDVLVRAAPEQLPGKEHAVAHATLFAVTDEDGALRFDELARIAYRLDARADDRAPASEVVTPNAKGVTITLAAGLAIAGRVVTTQREPVPTATLLVLERRGAGRVLVSAKSFVDANGAFTLRVPQGSYELVASAPGWAPSAPIAADAGARDVELTVSAGATLRGRVIAADGSGPIQYARIMREARGGGASAQPANPGTVTRSDGTFELAGIPPGPLSITIGAGGFHPKIEAGMTARDGDNLGPIEIALAPLGKGEKPTLELVGIGVQLAADGDTLRVDRVFPDSGAAAAGIVEGDRIVAVDGVPVTQLGVDGAVSKIRGVEGTTIAVTLRRGDELVPLVVTRKKLRA